MIRFSHVRCVYRRLLARPVTALEDLTYELRAPDVVGVVGLNGAGKSTLLRLLLGYVRPEAGEVRIDGLTPRRYVEAEGVAYLPERVAIPERWTVDRALTAYAMLADAGTDALERVRRVRDRFGLAGVSDRKVGALSKGNLQRLGLAQALLHERRLMVLDEPTDGLDPLWRMRFLELMEEWRSGDPARVLIVASHDLALLERLCTRVLLLSDGRLAAAVGRDGWSRAGGLERWFLERVTEGPEQ